MNPLDHHFMHPFAENNFPEGYSEALKRDRSEVDSKVLLSFSRTCVCEGGRLVKILSQKCDRLCHESACEILMERQENVPDARILPLLDDGVDAWSDSMSKSARVSPNSEERRGTHSVRQSWASTRSSAKKKIGSPTNILTVKRYPCKKYRSSMPKK